MNNGNYKVVKKKRNLVNMVPNNMPMMQGYNPNYQNMNGQPQMMMNVQPQMMNGQPQMMMNPAYNNYQPQNPNNRGLFLEGLTGGLGSMASGLAGGASKMVGGVVGGAKDAVSGVGKGLGKNGGAGIGLLGAGAGLAMATMGKGKEREELSNLEQDLRSKEMRYFMHINKKNAELDHLEHGVAIYS